MKKILLSTLLAATAALPAITNAQAPDAAAPAAAAIEAAKPAAIETDSQKTFYSLGFAIWNDMAQIKELGFTMEVAAFVKGVQDAASGATPALDEAARETTLTKLNQVANERAMAAQAEMMQQQQSMSDPAAGADNLAAAMAFLEENAKKEGVTTTASGLQYKVLATGDGPETTATSRVSAHYTGKLLDGTVFDSSIPRGEPITFSIQGGVIPGWIEAAKLMRQGDKWELYIPPSLAYGERGAPGAIPPNSALIFEVELVNVQN